MTCRLPLLTVCCLGLLSACDRPPTAPATATAATPAVAAPASAPAADAPAPAANAAEANALLDRYDQQATVLAAALGATGGDRAALQRQSEALVDLAAAVTPAYVARHPHCGAYLQAALQVRDAWPSLDPAAIERDYHHDGALPRSDQTGSCYHMKDLIVHPATVLVLLSQPSPDYVKSKAEVDEVIAHLGLVRKQL